MENVLETERCFNVVRERINDFDERIVLIECCSIFSDQGECEEGKKNEFLISHFTFHIFSFAE